MGGGRNFFSATCNRLITRNRTLAPLLFRSLCPSFVCTSSLPPPSLLPVLSTENTDKYVYAFTFSSFARSEARSSFVSRPKSLYSPVVSLNSVRFFDARRTEARAAFPRPRAQPSMCRRPPPPLRFHRDHTSFYFSIPCRYRCVEILDVSLEFSVSVFFI